MENGGRPPFDEIQKANLDKLYQRNPEWQALSGRENRKPHLTLVPPVPDNVIPFPKRTEYYQLELPTKGMGAEVSSFSELNGPTAFPPVETPQTFDGFGRKLEPESHGLAPVIDMFPGVPYELLGRTGFEADDENPAMGHEGRGFRQEPVDEDAWFSQ